jgi:hypothetical protein
MVDVMYTHRDDRVDETMFVTSLSVYFFRIITLASTQFSINHLYHTLMREDTCLSPPGK